MTIVLFAGGAGTRLWPLSRKATPKQFARFFNGKSTLELAIERVQSFGLEQVYVSTQEAYVPLVREQIPGLPADHVLAEPAKRDLAAAVCLTLLRLKQRGVTGTVAMIWSDHLMERTQAFVAALKEADACVQEDRSRLVFMGERPRFANHNLGWIHVGPQDARGHHAFLEWRYRPEKEVCDQMFASQEWLWNPGYVVYDLDTVLDLYRTFQPAMLHAIEAMMDDPAQLSEQYPQLEALHFDTAIAEHVRPEQARVLPVNLGWSDPGTLYAMKEALAATQEETVEQGRVVTHGSRDCLVYNEVPDQLVTTVGLDGVLVVNTPDGLLVCHKDAVPDIKALLQRLEDEGLASYL